MLPKGQLSASTFGISMTRLAAGEVMLYEDGIGWQRRLLLKRLATDRTFKMRICHFIPFEVPYRQPTS